MALEPELSIQGMSIASRMPLLLAPHSYQRKKIYVRPLTCSYTTALGAWTCRVHGPHWMDNVISMEISELTLFHSFIDHSHIDLVWSKWKPSRWWLVFSHSVLSASMTPMDCSTPHFPVLHHLLELVQTQVHWVHDAIQHLIFCHPLLLLPSIFPSTRVFSNGLYLPIRWSNIGASASASILQMTIQGWFHLGWTGLSLC